MDKHIKIIYGLLIVGFLSISAQVWLQNKTINELNTKMELQNKSINELNTKMESVRELLFRFA